MKKKRAVPNINGQPVVFNCVSLMYGEASIVRRQYLQNAVSSS